MSVIEIRHLDAVALVTLNRPERRNALDIELIGALREAMTELDADPATRAIVLTGADPAFCAGLDLRDLAGGDRSPAGSSAAAGRGPIGAMTTPLIGAINGAAVTGGFELALACDLRLASERARFADTHARVGIMPGWGLTVRLPAVIGVARAREMSWTGNFIDATTALQWGLVNHVVAHDDLLPTVLGLAAEIAGNDPEAVDTLRGIYAQGEALDAEPRWSIEGRTAGRMPAAFDEQRRLTVMERGRQQSS